MFYLDLLTLSTKERKILGEYHGGQGSALYSASSCGAVRVKINTMGMPTPIVLYTNTLIDDYISDTFGRFLIELEEAIQLAEQPEDVEILYNVHTSALYLVNAWDELSNMFMDYHQAV